MYTFLEKELDKIRTGCTQCGACRDSCAFLRKHGLPGEIAENFRFSRAQHQSIAYECSLCGLCGAVCPENLDPAALFHAIRCESVSAGNVDLSRYRAILRYEKLGSSPLFSYYGLPRGGDTVFFPGCALPGTRPEVTGRIFEHLQERITGLGIVLDCCSKPSHDLGRSEHFSEMFGNVRRRLRSGGIRKVIVACPNCYSVFKDYGDGLEVRTVYEEIDLDHLPAASGASGEMTIHDPCPLRRDTEIHGAVRRLLAETGVSLSEMKHNRTRALCCGEGGSVGFVDPGLARSWGEIRRKEAGGRRIVTYCAGCAGALGRITRVVHAADLLFDPQRAVSSEPKVFRGLSTYINRFRLKRRFRKIFGQGFAKKRICKQI